MLTALNNHNMSKSCYTATSSVCNICAALSWCTCSNPNDLFGDACDLPDSFHLNRGMQVCNIQHLNIAQAWCLMWPHMFDDYNLSICYTV